MESKFFDSAVFALTSDQWQALGPYLWLAFGIAFCTLCASLKWSRNSIKIASGVFLVPYALWLMNTVGTPTTLLFGTSMQVDALTRVVGIGVSIFAFITTIFSSHSGPDDHPEWGALLLTCTLGLSLLPGARDFIAFFIDLETLAVCGYIMTALDTSREESLEAGLKYLMLGAFASAIFLMGATFLYGLSGSFDFEKIAEHSQNLLGFERNFASCGAVLLITSLMFKVALVPYHMWAPDVYQAGPTSMAAFLASATKLSLFAGFAVVVNRAGLLELPVVRNYLYIVAMLSILGGSIMAIAQVHVRRLFAYSSVANAGYGALALAAGPRATGSLVLFMLVYGGTLICIFALVESFATALGEDPHADVEIAQLGKAAAASSPLATALFAFAVFSIASIPPLPGFFTKYLILRDIWLGGLDLGTLVLLLGTLLGLAYYLKLFVPLYLNRASDVHVVRRPAYMALVAAFFAALLSVLLLGGLNRLPGWVQTVEGFVR